jgi:hypothetical protein
VKGQLAPWLAAMGFPDAPGLFPVNDGMWGFQAVMTLWSEEYVPRSSAQWKAGISLAHEPGGSHLIPTSQKQPQACENSQLLCRNIS